MDGKLKEIVSRFEKSWQQGQKPSIAAELDGLASEDRPELFRELLRLELRLKQVEEAFPRMADYLSRFPEDQTAVKEIFSELDDSEGATRAWTGAERDYRDALPGIGDRIDRYVIKNVLGKGGFGTVYRAYDPQLERDVAIKIPYAHFWTTEEERHRLLHEARAAASLTHPNVCPIYEAREDRGRPFIAMAWIDGRPLSRLLDYQTLSEQDAVMLVRQISLTVEEAHRAGAVHRDLKPANIMIDNRGNPILTDFGIALRAGMDDDDSQGSGERAGTPAYMSPEQVRGEQVGPSSDIYSLGVVFYLLLTGKRPFNGTTDEVLEQILHQTPEPPSNLRADIDPRVEAICLTALNKKVTDRFASMRDMAEALSEVVEQKDSLTLSSLVDATLSDLAKETTVRSERQKQVPPSSGERKWRKAVGVGLLFIVVCGAVFGASSYLWPSTQESGVAEWLSVHKIPYQVETNGRVISVQQPTDLPNAPFRITSVDFSHWRRLQDEDFEQLKDLSHLQELRLSDTSVGDAALDHIQDLHTLELLWIDRTQITDTGLVKLKSLRKLRSLSCNGTRIFGNGLSALARHPCLARLSLKQTSVGDKHLQHVGAITTLTHLWLDDTPLTDSGLVKLASLSELELLSLSETDINGSGLGYLSTLPALNTLLLKKTELRDANLVNLGSFPTLTHLYVDETEFGNDGLSAVVDAAPTLERLSLGFTKVTGISFEALTRLSHLEMLTLDNLPMRRRGLEFLAAIPTLRALSLRSPHITDRLVPEIQQLTQLKALYLSGSRVSGPQREVLKAALPECEFP